MMSPLPKGQNGSLFRPNWYLIDETNTPICTFVPSVVSVIHLQSSEGTILRKLVRLSLGFKFGEKTDATIPLSEVQKTAWFEIDNRCILNAQCRYAAKYIATVVQAGLSGAPIEKRYAIDRMGLQCIEDSVIYIAGDRVITRSHAIVPNPPIDTSQLHFRFDIDPTLDRVDAFNGMRELIGLSPEIGRVLVAHVISGITRAAFKKVGFTPCAVLVIAGKSGMLKSHYVPHLTQMYDRADGIGAVTRFNSTSRFIEDMLYEYSECTAVIDDLHTAESKSIKKRNEGTAEEIIRRISDDTGRGRMDGKSLVQKKFRGNAVFIGEYVIGKASTIPRALVLELKKRPNGAILDKYQRGKPLLVSTFYYYFIHWYVDHYEDICSEIDRRLTKFREESAFSEIHGRLSDTFFYLRTAYMLFLSFCQNAGCCSRSTVKDEFDDFSRQLAVLVRAQQERFNQDAQCTEKVNYLKLIREIYKSGGFCLANSAEHFNLEEHDGLIHYDCLCLRSNRLRTKVLEVYPEANDKCLVKDLLDRGALKTGDKNTVQIGKCGGLRFYAVPLCKLKKDM